MSFNTITDPSTSMSFSIFSNEGRALLKHYVNIIQNQNHNQLGGSMTTTKPRRTVKTVKSFDFKDERDMLAAVDRQILKKIEKYKTLTEDDKRIVRYKLEQQITDLEKKYRKYINSAEYREHVKLKRKNPVLAYILDSDSNARSYHTKLTNLNRLLESMMGIASPDSPYMDVSPLKYEP